jgi:DNA-directed RNA polymerase subunit RPC12/RpoP
MHSTHEVSCKICWTKLAFWSGFGDNMQFANEYECQGKVFRKMKGWWQGFNSSGKKMWSGNFKPTKRDLKGDLKHIKTIKPLTKELTYCSIVNNTQFCEKCAKELNYKCPVCGKEIKLTRNR